MEFEPDNTDVFSLVCRIPTANQESNGYNAWTVESGPILIVQEFQQMKNIIFVTAVCQIKQRH